jgi:DnaK suppressor protein
MTTEMMLKFKRLFETERRNLVYSHSVVNTDFHLNQDDMLDELDITSSEMEQSMRLRLRNREALYLKKIDEALARIHSGTFGCCDKCGSDIEQGRLQARPTTTMCVSCKEEDERAEHLHIDGHRHKSLGRRIRLG